MKLRTDTTQMVELLQETVDVWKAKLEQAPENIQFGIHACPLCKKYRENVGCPGCPVSIYTGRHLCFDTPYDDVVLALKQCTWYGAPDERLQEAIKKEITFLTKLLHIYLDIEAQEYRMELAQQTDNAYHISGRYNQDMLILNNLKALAKKGQD